MCTKCERTDCRYYSTYTETCDFTLLASRVRQCPAESCTEYRKREATRSWQKFISRKTINSNERFVIAGCGHEVYTGENIYTDNEYKKLCPDCIEDAFKKLSTEEKAHALGYAYFEVAE